MFLLSIIFLKKHFNIPIGFSDHSTGIESDAVAAALGATIIEKHFTVSRNLEGCDQIVSLEFPELKLLVKSIRQLECFQNEL